MFCGVLKRAENESTRAQGEGGPLDRLTRNGMARVAFPDGGEALASHQFHESLIRLLGGARSFLGIAVKSGWDGQPQVAKGAPCPVRGNVAAVDKEKAIARTIGTLEGTGA